MLKGIRSCLCANPTTIEVHGIGVTLGWHFYIVKDLESSNTPYGFYFWTQSWFFDVGG